MKTVSTLIALAIAASIAAAAASQDQASPVSDSSQATSGLTDLEAITFGCPKAALNAAARRAAKVPSQGTYQFSYFNIVSDTHHAVYEVRFKSNYEGEAELKYCVEIYCQQGWDPKTAKTSIRLLPNAPQRGGSATHAPACHEMPAPSRPRTK
jgi:hypothetical protein